MRKLSLFLVLLLASPVAHAADMPFEQWLATFKADAAAEGIPSAITNRAMDGIEVDARVIKLDRKQPEDKISFTKYKGNILSESRIRKGRALYKEHHDLLARTAGRIGVSPQYIVALWGIETNFGGYTGNFNTVQSLATMAYEGRRADFFRKELLAALRILAEGKIKQDTLEGSWAGAMGQCQFMPSSYLRYAVDGDGDGVRDIWHSLPDVFSSMANYLKSEGWNDELRWGREVRMPAGMELNRETLYEAKPLAEFAAAGVTRVNGAPLPDVDVQGYIMHPGEPHEGTYIVYDNYHVLLDWNRSRYFATAVGLLADAIAAGGHE